MTQLTGYDKFIQQALKYGFSLFGLPKTGQTVSYDTGDDGEYKKGYPRSGTRFTDNGDGTITDNATGLMWPKDGNGAGCFNGASENWSNALSWAKGLVFAGYSDWRLPNIKELQSIVDYGRTYPLIDPIFINTKADYYWTSTTNADYTDGAWVVLFFDGDVDYEDKPESAYMRPVRGGI